MGLFNRTHRQAVNIVTIGFLLTAAVLACTTRAHAQTAAPDAGEAVSQTLQKLQRFEGSRDLRDLRDVIDTLGRIGIDINHSENDRARRSAVLPTWALLFRAIDRLRDPSFNPNDPAQQPALCLEPPREASGVQLPSCADPKDVHDPHARAEYEKALRLNEEKASRAFFQGGLISLDDRAMRSLGVVLYSFRADLGESRSQLDGVLLQSSISASRRSQLEDAAFQSPT